MSAGGGAAARDDSSSDGSSLAGFGEELEAELRAAAEAEADTAVLRAAEPAVPPARPAPAASDEPDAKRLRADGGQADGAGPAAICPPHPGFMHGMCIRCCARKEEAPDGDEGAAADAHVPLSYISEGLELREEEVTRLRADEQRRVLAGRKLFLILDLDHTLLNSARTQEIDEESMAKLQAMTLSETARPGGPELYDLRYMRLWTKLRPGARALLAAAAPLCEILVYTMGDRAYAVEMARLLDPAGTLLRRGRLIAAQDCRTSGAKDLDVVLGAAPAALILDDTPGVWRRHAENVIVAERYHFFPASARGHGGDAAHTWLARDGDESEADGVMAALLRVIRSVHAAFFDGSGNADDVHARDVRPLLRNLRARVLAGCVLLFSRVIPLAEQAPERHAMWRLATELGAVCAVATREDATHVVAGAAGTEKGRWAAQRGLPCVSLAWLRACGARWERMPEANYAVERTAAGGA